MRLIRKKLALQKTRNLSAYSAEKDISFLEKKQLNNNISIISRCMSQFDDTTSKEMIRSFSPVYQGILDSYFFHPSVEHFLEKPYLKNPYQPEDWNYFSNSGVPVRSKSEVLIANQLEDYGIPYRYDAALALGKRTKYPDFTIKNPFNGKIILWEHFGALNQVDYEQKMNDKMTLYMKYGYIPLETLIYTFEFDIRNARRLQDLIEHIILQP